MKRIFILTLLTVCFQWAFAAVYYVSPSGNDVTGNGTSTSPWRTLKFAVTKVPASQGHTIKLSAGTFIENGQFNVPLGVNIEGAGVDQTIIKAASSFYFNPGDPGFALDKFLITLSSSGESNGNQSLKSFTLDGDGKRLHGGIYVRFRNNVLVENIKVQNTNFCGLWIWDVKYSAVKQVKLLNCSWASTGWAAGALMLSNLQNVEFDRMDIDENMGYGVKALGTSGHKLVNMKFHDSRVSVVPTGKWNNGSAPNISIELWSVDLIGCEIYNTYMDNHLSLVAGAGQSTTQSIRVYNNIIDLLTRANGNGYGIELSVSNAEVDHNWIRGGSYGIAHWSPLYMSNWKIHHNTFYGLNSGYPGDIVRSQKSGIHNVKLYNNTVEFTGATTINFVGLHGGPSDNVEIKNNLIINSNTSYNWFPNQLIFMENGATLSGLTVTNNLLDKLPIGSVAGSYANNKLVSGQIAKVGNRPDPYYLPTVGSALIDAGVNVGYTFQGSAPDIGAYEIGGSVAPVVVTGVSITPGNVQLNANATSQLTKTVSPTNATNQNVSWTSSNMSVASVSATGLVTAGTISGSATITCTTADGNKIATSTITVSAPIPVVTVSITNPNPALSIGATSQLTKVIGPVNATNQNVTWSSSNSSVASVSTSGLVTALAPGNATLTVKTVDGSKIATSSVAVTTASSDGVTMVDIDDSMLGAGTNQFNYNGAWTHGANSSSAYLNETCSYSNVASNYVTLNFTGNKVELYTSLASSHGIAAVSVDNGPEKNVDLYAATRQNFTMVFSSGSLSQGNHSIKIRVTGSKNAASTGSYIVLDYLKVYSGTAASNPVTGISVSPANLILTESGATSQLTKVISPTNATNQNVIWSSSNTAVATVATNGLVTAKASGNATITVTTADGNKIAVSAVTVNIPITSATDIDDSILGGGTNQFNYSGAWTHGTNASDAYLMATCSYSNVSSNSVTLNFTGNKVELYTSLASSHGIAAVSIDNGPEKNVDLYAATRQNYSMVFSSGALAQGNHTIKIRVTGTKNAASTGTYIVLDYLKVHTISGGSGGGSQSLSSTIMKEEIASPVEYFPNPVKSGDILNVKLPAASGEVTIISMTGVPLLTLPVTNSELQIPTSGLLRGMYLLQYRTRNNNEVVKIMVQ